MNKKNANRNNNQSGNSKKEDSNAGSSAFNQGIEQDPSFNDGTKVSDEEKRTGHSPSPGKKKEHSKEKSIYRNNLGGKK